MVKQENSDEAEAVTHPLLQDLKSLEGQNSSSSEKGASFSGAVFNISTTMIGAGIMSIPATIKVLGIVPGFILILLVALVVEVTVEFLLRGCSMWKSFWRNLALGYFTRMVWLPLVEFSCLCASLHCTLCDASISLVTPSRFTRHTSAVSILLAVVFVVICSAMAIYALCKGKTQKPRLFPDFAHQVSVFDLFTTIPILVTVHPIRAELGKPSDMRSAARISLVISIIIYFSIGFFGYLLFGDSVMDDILVNFDQSSDSTIGQIINDIVRLSYAVHLLFVFPIMNFSLRANIDELLFPNKPILAQSTSRFLSLTFVLLSFTYIVAIAIPSIWYFFQFMGSTTVVCLSFIFPAALILRDGHGISTRRDKIIAILVIILAVVTSSIAMSTTLYNSAQG
ncbi:amino acid transporter AVT6D-like isoform X2 [Prunus avium]|uniref:Amino acid transporter AVT6D-like isoform X2 n=1 Tax=Prunus avium TaxID=42229 RepID=A0A6P5TCE1_PRUAV|nr:amino acid transporter AVT6D-like isoform X2 [Prunus avium]